MKIFNPRIIEMRRKQRELKNRNKKLLLLAGVILTHLVTLIIGLAL